MAYELGSAHGQGASLSLAQYFPSHPTLKARILLLHRKHREALRLFQHVLQLNPNCKPDPRIGIGMCLWSLGYKDKARLAWQRSHELDPTDWSVNLLLGLYEYNAAMSDEETDEYATLLVESSLARITSAFKKNNKSAAASNILAEILLLKKEKGKVRSTKIRHNQC